MVITTETKGIENELSIQECIIREPKGMDYASAAILLRNLSERRDVTSLEREALSVAVRLLQRSMEEE